MRNFDFLIGFLTGWILTTEEGKQTANKLANKTLAFVKSCAGEDTKDTEPEHKSEQSPES